MNLNYINKKSIICSILGVLIGLFYLSGSTKTSIDLPTERASLRDFDVNVKAVGELEAARSTVIASTIRGDQGKIIFLVNDGLTVQPGDILIKLDPTPFEEKVEKLKTQIKEQESYVEACYQALAWEKVQAENETRTAQFELEAVELELDKLIKGDGPLEIARLKGAMQKACLKYEDLNGYSQDLQALEAEGFLNLSELKQAQKKLNDELEAYEAAKMQYESYIQHVYPMQVKKAETAVKRAMIHQEDSLKSGGYKIGKAQAQLEQAEQTLRDYHVQLHESLKELAAADVCAPASGMVVLREDYRSGQKRKPRLGDVVLKNQPILDLPDLSSMVVKTKVREVDLFKVAVGKKATIEVDAYPQLIFQGTVVAIGVLALSDMIRAGEEKYFEVRIALDQSDQRLRPGMTARAMIHAQKIHNSLAIPVHAVFKYEKQPYCYVVKGKKYEKRAIELGAYNEQWAEVKNGLNMNENISLIHPDFRKRV